jgi:uncharacterized membrane protein YvbJ
MYSGEGGMVYCTKCGAKNPDDAKVCSQCGASLYPVKGERERYFRRYEDECFGIPRGGAIVGLAIGVIILLAGLLWLLQEAHLISSEVSVWPFAVMVFGILIVIGALFGMRRRY